MLPSVNSLLYKMLAFSYIRWSSTQQTSGDSLRRQTDLAAKYAAQHNLTLDNTSFQDHGVSAFKGKNVLEGSRAVRR